MQAEVFAEAGNGRQDRETQVTDTWCGQRFVADYDISTASLGRIAPGTKLFVRETGDKRRGDKRRIELVRLAFPPRGPYEVIGLEYKDGVRHVSPDNVRFQMAVPAA